MFTLKISGGPELSKALRELGDLTSDNRAVGAIKTGMVKASAGMENAANALAPSDDHGKKHIFVVASKSLSARQRKESRKASKDRIMTYVGEQAGLGNIGLLNEFGTGARKQASTGKNVGAIQPHPFMRPAFESTAEQTIAAMVPAIDAVVQKRAKAVAKKNAKLAKGGK